MPLRKVEIFKTGGGSYEVSECPLEKFKADTAGGGGGYTADPLEACAGDPEWTPSCNFADLSNLKEFDLEKICQCPTDMDWEEYNRLRNLYASTGTKPLTKPGFWEFVKENHRQV